MMILVHSIRVSICIAILFASVLFKPLTSASGEQPNIEAPTETSGSGASRTSGQSDKCSEIWMRVNAPSSGAEMPDLSGVSINTYSIRRNTYMLEASGDVAGNIAVLSGPEGVLIVDDQFEALVPEIETAIKRLDSGPLRYILNTHHHDDHSDGNAKLAEKSNALVVAQDATRKRLTLAKPPNHWPVLTFNSNLSLHFNSERVRLLSLPGGHTDNDTVVFFERANVVHLGDLMNSGISSFPIADIRAGGNALSIRSNVRKLIDLVDDETVIIPGHGPLSDKAGLQTLYEMLEDTIEMVKRKRKQGLNRDAVIAQGVPERYQAWGYGYTSAEDWLGMVWDSLVLRECQRED